MDVVVVIAEPHGYGFKSLFTSPLLDGFGQVASPLRASVSPPWKIGMIIVSTSGKLEDSVGERL